MNSTPHCALLLFSFFSSMAVSFTDISSGRYGDHDDWRLATATYTRGASTSTERRGGACGFGDLGDWGYGTRGATAVSSALFERGSACGGCFEVRCVNHILWCLNGSPSVVVTAADFCAPNFGLPGDDGGWCNFPQVHFEMAEAAFVRIARRNSDVVPVQYRRVQCERTGGMRFTMAGKAYFFQVLITNVGSDGQISAVKVKGSRTGWIPMGRNWGQNWQCDADLRGQPLSFEVTGHGRGAVTSYNVAPSNWQFGQTFEGKQFRNTETRA